MERRVSCGSESRPPCGVRRFPAPGRMYLSHTPRRTEAPDSTAAMQTPVHLAAAAPPAAPAPYGEADASTTGPGVLRSDGPADCAPSLMPGELHPAAGISAPARRLATPGGGSLALRQAL